jgi:TfoX/Sxy family transcriptional regulator of competence genes
MRENGMDDQEWTNQRYWSIQDTALRQKQRYWSIQDTALRQKHTHNTTQHRIPKR